MPLALPQYGWWMRTLNRLLHVCASSGSTWAPTESNYLHCIYKWWSSTSGQIILCTECQCPQKQTRTTYIYIYICGCSNYAFLPNLVGFSMKFGRICACRWKIEVYVLTCLSLGLSCCQYWMMMVRLQAFLRNNDVDSKRSWGFIIERSVLRLGPILNQSQTRPMELP